jgi:type II restriction enzyme
MSTTLLQALSAVHESALAFTKFITPNDTGKTGGHQAGFHIHKKMLGLFFLTKKAQRANSRTNM